MKTEEGDNSPLYFVLSVPTNEICAKKRASETEQCTNSTLEGALSMKDLSKHFKNEIKTVLNAFIFADTKPPRFLSFLSYYEFSEETQFLL